MLAEVLAQPPHHACRSPDLAHPAHCVHHGRCDPALALPCAIFGPVLLVLLPGLLLVLVVAWPGLLFVPIAAW